MENTVLGNALEGVPEESSEEGEKQNDSKIESADNLDGLCFKFCLSVIVVNFVLFMYAQGLTSRLQKGCFQRTTKLTVVSVLHILTTHNLILI